MKQGLKKKIISICLCTAAASTLMVSNAFAEYQDNNVSFAFRIQGSVDNAQESKERFRHTKDNDNSWKVQLRSSGEGKGTITKFWLENEDGKSASSEYDIKQGDPARYKPANKKGAHIDVLLTAENNNFCSTKQYNVSGYWDEETGRYL